MLYLNEVETSNLFFTYSYMDRLPVYRIVYPEFKEVNVSDDNLQCEPKSSSLNFIFTKNKNICTSHLNGKFCVSTIYSPNVLAKNEVKFTLCSSLPLHLSTYSYSNLVDHMSRSNTNLTLSKASYDSSLHNSKIHLDTSQPNSLESEINKQMTKSLSTHWGLNKSPVNFNLTTPIPSLSTKSTPFKSFVSRESYFGESKLHPASYNSNKQFFDHNSCSRRTRTSSFTDDKVPVSMCGLNSDESCTNSSKFDERPVEHTHPCFWDVQHLKSHLSQVCGKSIKSSQYLSTSFFGDPKANMNRYKSNVSFFKCIKSVFFVFFKKIKFIYFVNKLSTSLFPFGVKMASSHRQSSGQRRWAFIRPTSKRLFC